MSASSATTSPTLFRATNHDRPIAASQVAGLSANNPKPKRSVRRLVVLFIVGALILAGGAFWYIYDAGYETTDDATIEAHVIQVSPKIFGACQSRSF
jgi:multidrug resistance efflux pump